MLSFAVRKSLSLSFLSLARVIIFDLRAISPQFSVLSTLTYLLVQEIHNFKSDYLLEWLLTGQLGYNHFIVKAKFKIISFILKSFPSFYFK